MAALIVLHVSVVGICWGLDIFKIRDLADFIGWDNIEYVTVTDTHIDLQLEASTYINAENPQQLSETEKLFAYLEKLNNYINGNNNYKNKKVHIQYGGERPHGIIGLSNIISFRNYSSRSKERYDGFYSVICEMGQDIDFAEFNIPYWNNVREIEYWAYYVPENPETIKNLKKLEYVYFHEDIDDDIYNELCRYAPWCEIRSRYKDERERHENEISKYNSVAYIPGYNSDSGNNCLLPVWDKR